MTALPQKQLFRHILWGGKQVNQEVFLFVSLPIGAILAFVGLTAFLPVGIYRRIFGYVWPVGPRESRDKALQRRMLGAAITAVGLTALRAGFDALSGYMR